MFKSPTEDKKRLTRIISKLVPYRVGIEFECFGSVGSYLYPNLFIDEKSLSISNKDLDKRIKTRLHLLDFREDTHNFEFHSHNDGYDLNEVRISIPGYKGLIDLYNTLDIFKKCLEIPSEKGGIHIHIDAPFQSLGNRSKLKDYLEDKRTQSRILQIFEGYKGKYNQRGASISKGSYVRYDTQYRTIEFRIGHLTFDYTTIVRWIIELSEIVRECKSIVLNKFPKINKPNSIPKFSDQDVFNQLVIQALRLGVSQSSIDEITSNNEDVSIRIQKLNILMDYITNLRDRGRYTYYSRADYGTGWTDTNLGYSTYN